MATESNGPYNTYPIDALIQLKMSDTSHSLLVLALFITGSKYLYPAKSCYITQASVKFIL